MNEKQPGQGYLEAVLKEFGFAVTPIFGTPDSPHADLSATKDGMRTIIEVKARLEDPIFKELLPVISRDGSGMYRAGSGKTNAFSKKVKVAADQLKSSASSTDFRCLWFLIQENQSVEVGDQIRGTLLGRRFLLGGKEDNSEGIAQAEPCYVLSRADFFRFPEIDAAIIDFFGKADMIVNPASPRYMELKKWPLWKAFKEHDAIRDILEEERLKKAYVVPQEAKVKSDQEILDFVRRKYGLEGFLVFWDPVTYGAIAQLRRHARA
jgi:hypothetical protein